MWRVILHDLGLLRWDTSEPYVTLLFVTVAYFLRMYVHYLGQYFFLLACDIPVINFYFTASAVRAGRRREREKRGREELTGGGGVGKGGAR